MVEVEVDATMYKYSVTLLSTLLLLKSHSIKILSK